MIELAQEITKERNVVTKAIATVVDTFTGLWVTDVRITSKPLGLTDVTIRYKPFDPKTGRMLDSDARILVVEDAFTLAKEKPEVVGTAIDSLLAALGALAVENGLCEKTVPVDKRIRRISALPEPLEEPALPEPLKEPVLP